MHKNKIFTTANIITSLFLTFFLFTFSVVFTLNFRPMYYKDIDKLDIPYYSGFSEEEIRENYNELIKYNSVFYRGKLNFPTFSMSENGRFHFYEVKKIFDAVQIIMFACLIAGSALIFLSLKKKTYSFLLLSSIFSFFIPIILGILIAINWQQFFIIFHKIFFNNDYWIFDAETDPVILILPDTFFMHCAVMIIGIIMGTSILFFSLYMLINKKSKNINKQI